MIIDVNSEFILFLILIIDLNIEFILSTIMIIDIDIEIILSLIMIIDIKIEFILFAYINFNDIKIECFIFISYHNGNRYKYAIYLANKLQW